MYEPAADASFDRYARMVRRALGVPVALVSMVEPDRQVFPGAVGLPEPWQQARQTPLSHSFCQYVVKESAPLVVPDAREDERLVDNLAIPELGVVAYAGFPLTDHDGQVIGSLCAIDTEPHEWTDSELEDLSDLAAACSGEIAQRGLRELAHERAATAHQAVERTRLLLAVSEGLSTTLTVEDVAAVLGGVASDVLGCATTELWLRRLADPAHASLGVTAADPGHDGGEPMVLVPDLARGARREEPRTVVGGTPGGDALLRGRTVFFGAKAAERAAYGDRARADRPCDARAYLPLVLGRQTFGVLVLTWPDERHLDDDDLATVANLISYTAQAVQRALLLKERVDVSLTLQNALLTRLPASADLDLAARYQPARARDRVGGDWYDAVVLPSGEMSLIVGDVVGHDIAAAAKMGTLRHMLRALAWAQPDPPSTIVERLDRAVEDLDLGIMATLLYARVERSDDDLAAGRYTLRWTNAGHLPAVVIGPDGTARLLDTESGHDPMLGVLPEASRHDQRVSVLPGSTLLMFSDGLVERRDEDIEVSLDRLRRAAEHRAHLPVGRLLDTLIEDLVDDDPEDDLAVLAVRFPAELSVRQRATAT